MPNIQTTDFTESMLFPPAKGLHHTFPPVGGVGLTQKRGQGPITFQGATVFNNFRLDPSMISLIEGIVEISDGGFSGGKNKLIATYKNGSQVDMLVVNEGASVDTLRYFDIVTPVVTTAFTYAAKAAKRLSYVYFRDHILIQSDDTSNALVWYDAANRTARKAGVGAPGTAPTLAAGAAGALTGAYEGVVTFVNDRGHESNPSSAGTVTVATQKIAWSSIPLGGTGTSSRKLYRSVANASNEWFLVTTLSDNTTTTYTDNTSDSALSTVASITNTTPPTDIAYIAADNQRVALLRADGRTVHFCKIDDTTSEPNWEAFPTTLSQVIPFAGGDDTAQALAFYNDELYVFGRLNIYTMRGDISTGLKVEKRIPGVGLFWPYSFVVVPGRGIFFLSQTKQLYFYNGESLQDVSIEDISGLLKQVVPGSGASGPNFEYDPNTQSIYMNLGLNEGTNPADGTINTTLIYSLRTGEFTRCDWAYNISHFSNFLRNMYGAYTADEKIYGWWTGTTEATTLLYTQKGVNPSASVQFIPWSPDPGYDIEYGWVEIIVEAKPVVSSVLPTLKVSYSLDGSTIFTSRFFDISRDFLVAPGSFTSSVSRTLKVPIFKTARTMTLKVENTNNTASNTNGIEMYKISCFARSTRQTDNHDQTDG